MIEAWALALVGSPWIFVVLYLFATIDGFFPPVPSESIVIALAALAIVAGRRRTSAGHARRRAPARSRVTRSRTRSAPRSRCASCGSCGRRAGRRPIDWAEHALAKRGAAFIIAARYIPIGRVAVNMTAGAVGYPRRRFVGLTAHRRRDLGRLLGAHRHRRRRLAAATTCSSPSRVGVVGGIVLGLVIDWVLRKLTHTADEPPTRPHRRSASPTSRTRPGPTTTAPVTGRSRSDPAA